MSDEKACVHDDNEHNDQNKSHLEPIVLSIEDINAEAALPDPNYIISQ